MLSGGGFWRRRGILMRTRRMRRRMIVVMMIGGLYIYFTLVLGEGEGGKYGLGLANGLQ